MNARIDFILFDMKEALDDFGNEIKLLMSEVDKLSKRVQELEEEKFKK